MLAQIVAVNCTYRACRNTKASEWLWPLAARQPALDEVDHRQQVGDAVDHVVRARRGQPLHGLRRACAGTPAGASACVSASESPKTLPLTATPTVQAPPFRPSAMPTSVSSTLTAAQAGQTPSSSSARTA